MSDKDIQISAFIRVHSRLDLLAFLGALGGLYFGCGYMPRYGICGLGTGMNPEITASNAVAPSANQETGEILGLVDSANDLP